MVPFSLILNELITNSLKHAFGEAKHHDIKIEACEQSSGIVMQYSDSGPGLPEDTDFTGSETLERQLISSLAAQLGGTMQIVRRNGRSVCIFQFTRSKGVIQPSGDKS